MNHYYWLRCSNSDPQKTDIIRISHLGQLSRRNLITIAHHNHNSKQMAGRFREWSLDCKVYIGNLPEGASKTEIEALFNKYGPLKNVWVARNPPGFAFVEFEDPRDAEDAVRALDGSRVAGSRVRVEMSHGRSRRERGGPGRGPRGPPHRGGPPPPR